MRPAGSGWFKSMPPCEPAFNAVHLGVALLAETHGHPAAAAAAAAAAAVRGRCTPQLLLLLPLLLLPLLLPAPPPQWADPTQAARLGYPRPQVVHVRNQVLQHECGIQMRCRSRAPLSCTFVVASANKQCSDAPKLTDSIAPSVCSGIVYIDTAGKYVPSIMSLRRQATTELERKQPRDSSCVGCSERARLRCSCTVTLSSGQLTCTRCPGTRHCS